MAMFPPWSSALREELNTARQKGKWQARNRYLNGEQLTPEEKELEEEERVLNLSSGTKNLNNIPRHMISS
jgi:hypothetical protein